jgi:AsmA protein
VDEIALIAPRIRVVRHADSSFNFSDLVETPSSEDTPDLAPAEENTATRAGAAAAAISLHIANLILEDGTLEIIDHVVAPENPQKYTLGNFNLKARDIALRQAFPLEASCTINGAVLEIAGQVDLLPQRVKAHATLKQLDVEAFAPYFAAAIPGELKSLLLSAQLDVEASPETITSNGEITLEDISLHLDALLEAPIDAVAFVLNYTAAYQAEAASVELAELNLDYNGIKANIRGDINALDTTPHLNLDLNIPETKMQTLVTALPPQLVNSVQDMNPSGTFRIRSHLEGKASAGAALLKQADVRLNAVEADVEGMRPRLDGGFILADARLQSEDLTLKIGSNVAHMELTSPDVFATPLQLTHTMRAERFDLDALLASAAAPAAAADQSSSAQKGSADKQELGPFDIPLELNGRVAVAEALYQGLSVTDFALKYHLRDNVLDIENFSGALSDGTFTQKAKVDLRRRGLSYTGNSHVEGVQVDPVISALAPEQAHTLFGALNLDLEFSGSGTLVETLKKSLNATGRLNVQQARIKSTRLTEELASFLSLAQLRDIRFDTVAADVKVRDAVAQIESNFSGTNMRARPQGSIGLDGDLDLALNARLSPHLTEELDRKGHVAAYLTDAEGWALLPVKVKGTYEKPRISLDQSALTQQTTRKAVEDLKQRLLDKIAPEQNPAVEGESETGTPPTQEDPTRKLIDDAFKSIFGQ